MARGYSIDGSGTVTWWTQTRAVGTSQWEDVKHLFNEFRELLPDAITPFENVHDPILPPASGTIGIATAASLNRAATGASERQLAIAGAGSVVPLVYGEDRIGARILNIIPYGGAVLIQALWGFTCESVSSILLSDDALPTGATATTYTGTQSSADATLVAAFAAQGITYADTLAGFAYSVVSVPVGTFSGAPNVTALVKGRKVYDHRSGLTVWSDNPTLALVDFLTSTTYGAGLAVDYASADLAATANDVELAPGEKHRTVGVSFTSPTRVADVIETLRTYAGVFLARRGGTVYFIKDATRASDATYAHASGEIASFSDFEKRDLGDSPTVVEVIYTDRTQNPWRDSSAFAELPGVGTTLPRRLSTVRLPGVQRYSQARREAIERLNKLTLNDLAGSVTVFDKGIAHELGDVVTISLPIGVDAKPFRVSSAPEAAGPGLWRLALGEYDPAVYSSAIETRSTYADTTLPNPSDPPQPASITATEETFQQNDGSWNSRVRISVPASSFLFLSGYRFEIWNGSTLVDAATALQPTYATPPLEEGITYTVKAQTLSMTGASSAWKTTSITFYGKLAPPTSVETLTAFEVGGDVYLSWSPANDLDLRDYELRWGTTSASWETATLLDRVLALRYISRGVVTPGVRRFFVKARDTVGNYSETAAQVDVTVTLDPDAMAIEYRPSSPTLTSMLSFTERDGSAYDVTSVGTSALSAVLTGTLSTYSQPLAAYWGGTSAWEGDSAADPWGVIVAGDWSAESEHAVVGTGSATLTLRLSENGTAFDDYTSFPAKDTARYARVKIATTTCVKVTRGGQRISANAITRSEYGSVSVTSTGTPGARIQMTGKYFTRRFIQLTPVGTGATFAVADNIQLTSGTGTNSIDVYAFNAAGDRVAATVDWLFQGI